MTQQFDAILARLRDAFPVPIPLTDFDKHPVLPTAKTIRNMRSARTIPSHLFFRDGRRVLVDMNSFIVWWGQRLREDHYESMPETPGREG